MRIFLIRHGESKANKEEFISGHSNVSLTKLGKAQATLLA
jgi:broad specificity phosphatase PhoE